MQDNFLATSVELFTTDLICLSKYFSSPTVNKISENIAIKIEGNKVVARKKIIYLKVVSDPNFPFFFHLKFYMFHEKLE